MTLEQEKAIKILDTNFGGHGLLLDDFGFSRKGPPAMEGWFGPVHWLNGVKPVIFCHIEPDGQVHT
jgi:hypothetical protein